MRLSCLVPLYISSHTKEKPSLLSSAWVFTSNEALQSLEPALMKENWKNHKEENSLLVKPFSQHNAVFRELTKFILQRYQTNPLCLDFYGSCSNATRGSRSELLPAIYAIISTHLFSWHGLFAQLESFPPGNSGAGVGSHGTSDVKQRTGVYQQNRNYLGCCWEEGN